VNTDWPWPLIVATIVWCALIVFAVWALYQYTVAVLGSVMLQ
jgi:hypothetical protein